MILNSASGEEDCLASSSVDATHMNQDRVGVQGFDNTNPSVDQEKSQISYRNETKEEDASRFI